MCTSSLKPATPQFGGGGGSTLIFSYIHRLEPFMRFNILNFHILGVFFSENRNYFGGYEDFVDILWVITKLDYI